MEEKEKTPGKKKKPKKKSSEKQKKKQGSLSKSVKHAVEEYFSKLEEAKARDLYNLVLREVEAPLLKVVMREANQNQSAAAEMLGLNRGTLRKKLKEYGLL